MFINNRYSLALILICTLFELANFQQRGLIIADEASVSSLQLCICKTDYNS